MVMCELCGKELRTTQGLRGHKTFVHGIRAYQGNSCITNLDESHHGFIDEQQFSEFNERFQRIEASIVELRRSFRELEHFTNFLMTEDDLREIHTLLRPLREQIEKHDRWFNPRELDEVVLGLRGGPIADLERRVGIQR